MTPDLTKSLPVDQESRGTRRAVEVENLTTRHRTRAGDVEILSDVSFGVDPGAILGIVGESGCGKSTLALALAGLLPPRSATLRGSILLDGTEVVGLPERELRRLRGRSVGFVPQDPMGALNPTVTVGVQLMEAPRAHLGLDGPAATMLALEHLEMVRLPASQALLKSYPHQLSGGMRQRVMIAIALSCRPALVVADEPTTALDVTVQAEVLQLFRELCRASGSALIIISHDLSVVADIADEIAVLYAGEIIERSATQGVTVAPAHPYTRELLNAVPDLTDPQCRWLPLASIPGKPPAVAERPTGCRFAPRCRQADTDECHTVHSDLREVRPGHWARTLHPLAAPTAVPARTSSRDRPAGREAPDPTRFDPAMVNPQMSDDIMVSVGRVSKTFGHGPGSLTAVDDVTLQIRAGQTYGLVGESGSGKSTLAHCVMQLARPYQGDIVVDGVSMDSLSKRELRAMRRRLQIIFQDARNSMDTRKTIGTSLVEPLHIHGMTKRAEMRDQVLDRIEAVGLNPAILQRFPSQCSGGELQRACIARALLLRPKMLICDEAVTSLDVSSRAQVVNLLRELQVNENLTMLFISHDFATITAMSDVVGVMRGGRLIEQGDAQQVLKHPAHAYTKQLLAAVPRLPASAAPPAHAPSSGEPDQFEHARPNTPKKAHSSPEHKELRP